jgi:DNA-binding NarL/FixJ family response regulator
MSIRVVLADDEALVRTGLRMMPAVDGIEAARRIVADPAVPTTVVMLTTFDDDELLLRALQASAAGFLLKSMPSEQLTAAIRVAAGGEAMLAPALVRRLLDHYISHHDPGPVAAQRIATLTDRERQVLQLIATGYSNAEIATQLYLGEGTVKTHVAHILAKLRVRDRVQAVVAAYEGRLVRPGHGPGHQT